MGDRFITDADGREYRVIEGELFQGEPYAMVWEDLAAEVDAEEAATGKRGEALTAVLQRNGRNPVFIERIPNSVDPQPSDGVARVYLWNTDGNGVTRPGYLMRANERPSDSFFQKQQQAAESVLADATAAAASLLADARAAQAELDKATALPEYRVLVEAGKVEEVKRLREQREQVVAAAEVAADVVAAVQESRAARTALGGTPDVTAIAAKREESPRIPRPPTPAPERTR